MIFTLKYLIIPLSIIVCINNNYVNARENNIINEVNQTPMPWVDFEAVLTSFQNNEPLNNRQIDFIKRIANEITYNVNANNWRNLITGQHRGFPRVPPPLPRIGQVNIDNNMIVQNQVNTTNLSNRNILSYLEKTSWLICLDGIPNNNNDNDIDPDDDYDAYLVQANNEYNEQVNTYITFISRIKECYNEYCINKDEYISLLNWLLYCNVHVFFNTVRQRLLVTWMSENHQTFNNRFANYLLVKTEYDKKEMSLIELYKKYADGLVDEIEYTSTLRVINKIIDDLISIYIDSSKLKQITPVDLMNNIKYKILKYIIQGIYDNAYYKDENGNEQQPKEYYKILNSQTAIDKIDTDFNITRKILCLSEYQEYKENYNQFINYYHGLYMKSKNDENYDEKSKETIQRPLLEDIKNKIQNKLGIKTNIESNNKNGTPLSGPIFETILPFLVHTKLDRKSNINNQTQNNQLQNNINEINSNNDKKDNSDDDESDDVD